MSPRIRINDLSRDIIEEIFDLVVLHAQSTPFNNRTTPPIPIPALHSPRYHSPASPYAISHVCRQWRYIALGYNRLWARLCVVKPRTTGLRYLLQEWMNRAKPFPLHLSLHEIDLLTPFATKAILTLFLNAVHECKSFELNIRSNTLKIFDMNNLRIQKPLHLDHVGIWTNDLSERPKTRSVLEPLFGAPSIRSVIWSNPGPMRFKKCSKSWVNLRELALLTPLYPEDLPTILGTCQALERLVINRPRASCQHITLPELRYLAVTIGSTDSLNWLTAPSLTDLELLLIRRVRLDTIAAMTERSDARLRTLRVKKKTADDMRYTKTEERSFLKMLGGDCFAELRELEVEQYVGVETIKFLTFPPSTQERRSNLPYLQSVQLTFFPNSRLLDIQHNLDALIASRNSACRDYVYQFSDETLDFSLSSPICNDQPRNLCSRSFASSRGENPKKQTMLPSPRVT
jgi:hypothetical protein